MSLTWRDAVATILTGGVALLTYAKLVGWSIPLLGSWRLSTLAVFALGIGTCIAAGSGGVPANDGWTTIATVLGICAAILLLIGLIFESKLVFILLAADVGMLWLVSTIHHVVT